MCSTSTPAPCGPLGIRVVAGPDAGWVRTLDWRTTVGRSRSNTVAIHDPAVEAHHAVLAAGIGGVVVTQLAGRVPIVVDGIAAGAGPTPVRTWVEIGHSLLSIGPAVAPWAIAPAPPGGGGPDRTCRVQLGVGTVRTERAGDPDGWPVAADRVRELAPIVADLAAVPGGTVAVVDTEARHDGVGRCWSIAQAIAAQVPPTWTVVRAWGPTTHRVAAHGPPSDFVVVFTDRPGAVRGSSSPVAAWRAGGATVIVVVLARTDAPVLRDCGAMLELGARWRARWLPDTADRAAVTRLHVAGRAGAVSGASGC